MPTKELVTAVIIAKNAGRDLEACLESIKWVDEIVLLDSGSTDDTVEIALRHGTKVHYGTDWPGFGIQRQRAQALASNDWVFMIDVDERVSPELQKNIEQILIAPNPKKAYRFNRLTDFFGRFIRTSGWHPDWVSRLYHKDYFSYNSALVHEILSSEGSEEDLKGDLFHYTTSTYLDFISKSSRYACSWADERYRQGKRVYFIAIPLRSLSHFIVKYVFQRGFLEGKHGFLLAILSSFYTFHKYSALWILNREQKNVN